MIIHDQHVHSYYSFDSEQPIEEYLYKAIELGLDYFVLTDHCDLHYLDKGKDIFFDLEKQNKELDKLQNQFKEVKILRGIEIGYKPTEVERINKIISSYEFDVINFSLHESDGIDYYFVEEFTKRGIKETLEHYFFKEIDALNNFDNFDVFCHFDYGFKTAFRIDNSLQISDYENLIIKLMKTLIEKDKTLEINIKVQSFLPINHTKYILGLYKELGGKNVTLSSDAHEVAYFRYNFDKYIKLIKDSGFEYLTYFVKREKKRFKL